MDLASVLLIVLRFMLFLPAIVVHEVAHGWVAYRLGDPTAKMLGRLSLNPLKHVDPWGTVLMPLILLTLTQGAFAFGYAKPVPINPDNFRDRKTGMLLTGIAGPAANLGMAIAGGAVYRLASVVPGVPSIVASLAWIFVYLNLLLMFFNLIPIPPMDGSRVVQRFLHGEVAVWYHRVEPYGFMILFGLLYFARPVIDAYFSVTVDPLTRLLTGTFML